MFDPDVPVVLSCVGICAVILVQARVTRQTLFTPLRMYLLTQAATLGIAYLRMSPAMSPLRPVTWGVLIGSAITFSVGCMAANYGTVRAIRRFDRDSLRPMLPFLMLIGFFLLLILSSMDSLATYGEWPIFSKDPETDRTKFVFLSTWGMWAFGHETVLLTLSTFLILFAKPLWLRITAGFILTISFAIEILIGIRNPLLLAVFVALCLWDIGVRRLKTRIIVMAGSAFLMVFILVAFLRARVIQSLFKTTEEGSPLERMFLPVYSYIANNYWNLDNSLEKWHTFSSPPYQYGLGMLHGFLQPFIRISTPDENGWLLLSKEKTGGLNTLTYHWNVWQDGGIILTLVFPFFWGWTMTRLYQYCESTRNLFALYLYSYLLFPVAFSFFSFYFVIGSYSLPIVWILLMLPFGAGASFLISGTAEQIRKRS